MQAHEIKIGKAVTYYSVILENGKKIMPFPTRITSDTWTLGSGEVVCKVEGKSGGVSIKHLEEREEVAAVTE